MQITDGELRVGPADGVDAERAAAGVWARATAVRDELPSVASVEAKLPGIQQALAEEGAALHLASRGRRVVGFCLSVPGRECWEIRYLATDPEVWGSGAGRALLEHVHEHARRAGFRLGELWVIADNARAIGVYERAGWAATDVVEVRGSVGRPERRFVRDLADP